MTIAAIIRTSRFTAQFSPYSPFVWSAKVRQYSYASFWTTTFGAADDSSNIKTDVRQIFVDYLDKQVEAATLNDCITQAGSFFYDDANQVVYVHFDHVQNPLTSQTEYGYAFGISSKELVNIGGYDFLPLIESIPNIEQSAEAVGASEPSGIAGALVARNMAHIDPVTLKREGMFDFVLSEPVRGNDVFISDWDSVAETEIALACLHIEDSATTPKRCTIYLQDKRASLEKKVPGERFSAATFPYLDDSSVDKPILIMYGHVAAIPLTCVNPNENEDSATTPAVYKLPTGTSDIGTAYFEVDDVWKAATDIAVDYELGTLELISGGRNSSGSSRKVKLVDPVGYTFSGHSYPREVLQHILETGLGIKYTASNYDTAAWEAELDSALVQADIGFLIDDETEIRQLIYDVSVKSKTTFRAWFSADGKITAKVKDYDRASSLSIPSAEIKNATDLEITTRGDDVYSSVVVRHSHNYLDDVDMTATERGYYDEVVARYRKYAELEIDSWLTTPANAAARAYAEALNVSEVPAIVDLELFGNLDIGIYDVITVSIRPDNLDSSSREFAGNHDCLVLSVNPDCDRQINNVTAVIIPGRVPLDSQSSLGSTAYTTVTRILSSPEMTQQDADAAAAAAALAQAAADVAAAQALLARTRITCTASVIYMTTDGDYDPDEVTFGAILPDGTAYPGFWKVYRGQTDYTSNTVATATFTVTTEFPAAEDVASTEDSVFGPILRAELYADDAYASLIGTFTTSILPNVLEKSQALAQAEAEVVRVLSAAYADGIVTAEETRAIADAVARRDEAIATASEDATTKAAAAADEASDYAAALSTAVHLQVDKTIATFEDASPYSDPSSVWATDDLKRSHHLDLWHKVADATAPYGSAVYGTWWKWIWTEATLSGSWSQITAGPELVALQNASAAQVTADKKTTLWASLALANTAGNGIIGDEFVDSSTGPAMRYRCTVAATGITLANSTRLTPKQYADVANSSELAALTGMIYGDSVYMTVTTQWYRYTSSWVTDGPSIGGTAQAAVPAFAPRYWGKYLDSAPTANATDDCYARYSTTSGTTYRGVFRWTGSAWLRTEDRKYIMQAISDIAFIIAYKNTASPPVAIYGTAADYTSDSTTQSDFAFFQAAVIGYVEANDLLVRKTLRVGGRYAIDGSITDDTVPGFFMSLDGSCKNAGMTFEGEMGGGVQWTGCQQVGSSYTLTGLGVCSAVSMGDNGFALYDDAARKLRYLYFNGLTFVERGTGFSLSATGGGELCALSNTDVVLEDKDNGTVTVYRFNFSTNTWSAIGNVYSYSGSSLPKIGLTALGSGKYARSMENLPARSLGTYLWDGTDITFEDGDTNIVTYGIKAVSENIVFSYSGSTLYAYEQIAVDNWVEIASDSTGDTISQIDVLNSTDVLVFHAGGKVPTNHAVSLYRLSELAFISMGSENTIGVAGTTNEICVLNGTDAVIIQDSVLKLYRWNSCLAGPYSRKLTG